MSREKPILFSGEMVRAILDGRKTRFTLPMKGGFDPTDLVFTEMRSYERPDLGIQAYFTDTDERDWWGIKSRYQPGDRLYVKEKIYEPGRYYTSSFDESGEYETHWFGKGNRVYAATDNRPTECRVVSSIHMPKEAARIWLEVTNVRVERLQDISEEDAKAEGANPACLDDLGQTWKTHRRGFQSLWDSIYGTWDKNPWVFVYDFKVLSTTGRPQQ